MVAVRITLASSEDRISSSNDDKACEISGLIDARVRVRNSVPYLCLTSSLLVDMNSVKFVSNDRTYSKFCLQFSNVVTVSCLVRHHCFGALWLAIVLPTVAFPGGETAD